ncbi:hypothetical protein CWE09_02650 [Aliidiomarina minuta]|uniref:DNA-directed DNA polymerase n=1 Tax=Aliidiomarina minuta TaxID=880057 RepID=A0A432W6Q0_9GAMM|nr:DNA polymerase III subunit delta' [Aliidiomarina minuta]RUO25646.1 hypothetical protein CWE09_02650 [Aliidiomarina minuta]
MKFPWLRGTWMQLLQSRQHNRLPHAIGIPWLPELATDKLLDQIAQWLLCTEAGRNPELKKACGTCKSCLLWQSGSHPDFYRLGEEEDKSLGVDVVRKLQTQLASSANQGGNKVALITFAEKLTTQAANALLKTLEEPPSNTYIIVASARFSQLLPTLRSRLQFYPVQRPGLEELADWLQTYTEQPVAAETWLQSWLSRPLSALQKLTSDTEQGDTLWRVVLEGKTPAKTKTESQALSQLNELEHLVRDLQWLVSGGAQQYMLNPQLGSHNRLLELLNLQEAGLLNEHCQQWSTLIRTTRQRLTAQAGLNQQLLLQQIITDMQTKLGVFNVR